MSERAPRIPMLGADGAPLGWTYDRRQYELVSEQVLVAVDALAGAEGLTRLQDVVDFVQEQLGAHELFPSGRMTNATRYVSADLVGRGVLEYAGGRSPRRLRRAAKRPPTA